VAYRSEAISEGLAGPGEPAGTRARADWTLATSYSLGFLTLVSAFNYLDRSLLGLAHSHEERDRQQQTRRTGGLEHRLPAVALPDPSEHRVERDQGD
jgi:hypothetical protein